MTYLTIEDSFRHNGDRHLERAFNHLYCGHPDSYWQGSIDKAIKNYKKADEFKLDPWTEVIFEPMIKELAAKIADCFLYGTQYVKVTQDGLILDIETRDVYDLHS